MQIYLASRYSRRVELCGYRRDLESLGHEVTSRWLDGAHQISDAGTPIGDHGEALIEGREGDDGSNSGRAALLRSKFAQEDIADLFAADTIIAFSEPPRSSASRGGRHIEFGIALGINRFLSERGALHDPFRLIVVGPRENIFHWLDEIEHFATWPECFAALKGEQEARLEESP